MSQNPPPAPRKEPAHKAWQPVDEAPVDAEDPTRNVAHWLQDVARRPWPAPPAEPELPRPAPARPRARLRSTVIVSALAAAFLQYYFIDVNLRIVSMHSLTVFVPIGIPFKGSGQSAISHAAVQSAHSRRG